MFSIEMNLLKYLLYFYICNIVDNNVLFSVYLINITIKTTRFNLFKKYRETVNRREI